MGSGMQAVRAYNRLAANIEYEQSIYAEMDAGFDAGEWSGPWHATQLEKELAELSCRVSSRFGITPEQLIDLVQENEMKQNDCCFDALWEKGYAACYRSRQ